MTSGFKEVAQPWYSDQILPFDITLCGTNEQGSATSMKIFGVEILNEGSGVSIDDASQEMQATFVARFVEPWTSTPSSSLRRVKIPSRGREPTAGGVPGEQRRHGRVDRVLYQEPVVAADRTELLELIAALLLVEFDY
jgi:hypothetical protein